MIFLQIDQANELGRNFMDAANDLNNPYARMLIFFMAFIIVFLGVGIYMLYNLKIKDFDDQKDTLKKKDEQIEEKQKQLMEMLNTSFKVQESFQQAVTELNITLRETNERNKSSYVSMSELIKDHHNYTVTRVDRIEASVMAEIKSMKK